jgi:hypothetical protein
VTEHAAAHKPVCKVGVEHAWRARIEVDLATHKRVGERQGTAAKRQVRSAVSRVVVHRCMCVCVRARVCVCDPGDLRACDVQSGIHDDKSEHALGHQQGRRAIKVRINRRGEIDTRSLTTLNADDTLGHCLLRGELDEWRG